MISDEINKDEPESSQDICQDIYEVLLAKSGELVLKGLNRHTFEKLLMKKLISSISAVNGLESSSYCGAKVYTSQSTTYVEPEIEGFDMDNAEIALSKVFGFAAYTRAAKIEKDLEKIMECAVSYLGDALSAAKTFKVEAKRSDKTFKYKSPEICALTGSYILDRFENLSVDVHNPDVTVVVEVRERGAYIHPLQKQGAGGMPIGSSGRAALLLSGGIDSPVAGYMMAKRGIDLSAIHFVAPPYTSDRAQIKVEKLAEKLTDYVGMIRLYIVPFTEIQEKIKEHCPEDLFTIIMRRFMVRISNILARKNGCEALVTGESVGQVASQTMGAIACTHSVSDMPIFCPLIGMDKEEIVQISRKIDTFETSILPYEDCCTVFTPRHPKTKPKIDQVERAEKALDMEALISKCVEETEYKIIG